MTTLLYGLGAINLLAVGFLLNDVCRSIDAKNDKWKTDTRWMAAALFNVFALTYLAQ